MKEQITTNCGKFFKRWEYHTSRGGRHLRLPLRFGLRPQGPCIIPPFWLLVAAVATPLALSWRERGHLWHWALQGACVHTRKLLWEEEEEEGKVAAQVTLCCTVDSY